MLSKYGNSKYGMECLLKIKKPGPRAKLNEKKILCNAKRPRQWERQKKTQ